MATPYVQQYGVGLMDDLHNYFPALLYEPDSFTSVRDVLYYIQTRVRNQFDRFSNGQRNYTLSNVVQPRATAPVRRPVPPFSHQRSRQSIPTRYTNEATTPPPLPARVRRTVVPNPTVPISLFSPPPSTPFNSSAESEGGTDISGSNTRGRQPNLRDTLRDVQGITSAIQSLLSLGAEASNSTVPINLFSDLADTSILNMTMDFTPLRLPHQSSVQSNLQSWLEPVAVYPSAEQIEEATSILRVEEGSEHLDSCAICQEEFESGDTLRKIDHCEHMFHRGCIDTWFQRDAHCPVCRHDIRENEPEILIPSSRSPEIGA